MSTHCYNLQTKKDKAWHGSSSILNPIKGIYEKSLREVILYLEGETNASLTVRPSNLVKR